MSRVQSNAGDVLKAAQAAGLEQIKFSPHPWGWTAPRRAARRNKRILPTPVGMDQEVPP